MVASRRGSAVQHPWKHRYLALSPALSARGNHGLAVHFDARRHPSIIATHGFVAVVVEAHLAKNDAALLAAVVAGQLAVGIVYIRVHAGDPVRWGLLVVFRVAQASGIPLQGPAAPALAVFTMATLSIADRNIRWIKALRPIAGLILTTLIAAPWFVAIEQATEGRSLAESLWQDLVAKLVGAQESYGAAPGSYLALSLASFWPGSLFPVPAVVWGLRRRRVPAQRFLIAWLFPACTLRSDALPSAGLARRRSAGTGFSVPSSRAFAAGRK
jgi:4-amino-4-deoxy-L-arabinose transferase-like glycosyltransferase